MKAFLLFTALLFCQFIFGQNENEFAPVGAEWHYNYHWIDASPAVTDFYHIVSERDTVIDGNSCRVLSEYYNPSVFITDIADNIYIIKQDGGKIYYYYQNQFNLQFDFDAQINDTVQFTFRCIYHNPIRDSLLSAKYKIENITINAQNLKTFTARIAEEQFLPIFYTYTEKIGYYETFMLKFNEIVLDWDDYGSYRALRCYSDADSSFVSDWWSTKSLPCDYMNPSNDVSEMEVMNKIYPTYFNDNIYVSAINSEYVEIIDISGNTVYRSELSDGINRIETNHFTKGIFFVKIRNNSSIKTFKTIKL